MSVDILQEKIRKLKNPSVVQLVPDATRLPHHIFEEFGESVEGCQKFCRELLCKDYKKDIFGRFAYDFELSQNILSFLI